MPYSKSTQKDYGDNPLQKKSGFKMKGYSYPGTSPMKKKTKTEVKDKKTESMSQKNPETGAGITGDDYDQIISDPKTKKSYVSGYNKMTKAQKKKHGKPVDGNYVINKQGDIKKI